MLSREIMGMFGLGVVWLTALLVAGAAWQDLRDLRALARRARRSLLEATIVVGQGEDGALAEWSVEQTGRALDGVAASVAFHDRGFRSRVFGGSIRAGDATYSVGACDGDVWPSDEARERAGACPDAHRFDEAYALARKAKGFRRDVRVALGAGDRLWVVGRVEGDAVVPPEGGRLLLSSIDPRRFCARKARSITLFIGAELLACAGVTRLAWSTPHFGALSVAGAVLCLAFFLGVTPLAVALREGARAPSVAYLRGTWRRAPGVAPS